MAKRIRCSDVGPDCDYEAMGDTEEDLLELVAEHADRAHGIEEISPELEKKIRGAMKDV